LNFKGVGVTLEVRLHRFILKKEAGKEVESREDASLTGCATDRLGTPDFKIEKKNFL
jgi:hypothetical protein